MDSTDRASSAQLRLQCAQKMRILWLGVAVLFGCEAQPCEDFIHTAVARNAAGELGHPVAPELLPVVESAPRAPVSAIVLARGESAWSLNGWPIAVSSISAAVYRNDPMGAGAIELDVPRSTPMDELRTVLSQLSHPDGRRVAMLVARRRVEPRTSSNELLFGSGTPPVGLDGLRAAVPAACRRGIDLDAIANTFSDSPLGVIEFVVAPNHVVLPQWYAECDDIQCFAVAAAREGAVFVGP